MIIDHDRELSRRKFCLCCVGATAFAASGDWLTPRQAFAEARNIVDLIRDYAAKTPIKAHKLHTRSASSRAPAATLLS
jgi:hypothetical protein